MNQEQLNRLVKYVTVLATTFVVILVGIITFQRIKFANLNNELNSMNTEIQEMTANRSELETDIENSKSPIYIEEMLRNKLIIKDGKIYFDVKEK